MNMSLDAAYRVTLQKFTMMILAARNKESMKTVIPKTADPIMK
jgi:hypothetical protein